MRLPFVIAAAGLVVAPGLGCATEGPLHVAGDVASVVETPGEPRPIIEPEHLRFKPEVCGETKAEYATIDVAAFAQFLQAQGFEVKVIRARIDLAYVLVGGTGARGPVRFRVAILPTAAGAGRELHEALLQHGESAWGVHRSNLAVLATGASLDDAVLFAAKTRLACWGVMTVAGHDDTFVIPGGYTEL